MSAVFSVFGTLTGCIGSMTCVESLAKQQPTSMNLLTFASFLFITLEGLIVTSRFLTVKNSIPIKAYLPVVLIFFLSNWINNQALNFHVPVPLHIIFRSGSLLTNLIMNKVIVGKSYSTQKYICVLVITIGIIICTLASSGSSSGQGLTLEEAEKHYKEWVIGIILLILALVLVSYLAIIQEKLYKDYGKHPKESMFYTHALSLPIFAFMGADIYKNAIMFNESSPYTVLGINTGIPQLWVMLLGACIGQWVCILFVYQLNSKVDSLSVTLVVTLRKFLSLLISIFWFGNVFTGVHWFGTILVFGGSFFFAVEKPKQHKE
ncbi:hypothetical protein FO519_001435 [Halicephalobus sp. NKZ332]|nr:hypothetical protein FO519_001435 [Halicephalobus sp. NKZ332]